MDRPAAPQPRSRWTRWLLGGVELGVAWGLFHLSVSWLYERPRQELARAEAEADRLDPGWRLHELQDPAPLPPEQNSALTVLAVADMLTLPGSPNLLTPEGIAKRPLRPEVEKLFNFSVYAFSPPMRLDNAHLRQLHRELDPIRVAAEKALTLAAQPRGCFPSSRGLDAVTSPMEEMDRPHSEDQCARWVVNLLRCDALLSAQEKRTDRALASGIAILNAGRSVASEPELLPHLFRAACQSIAVLSMERTLAEGQPSPVSLETAQWALTDEASTWLLLDALRGVRAALHQRLKLVEAGALPNSAAVLYSPFTAGLPNNPRLRSHHAWMLQRATQLVEIARRPIHEQPSLLQALESTAPPAPLLMRPLVPPDLDIPYYRQRLVPAFQRHQAYLRCAIVALAAERYRLNRGHWPTDLKQVVPEFLSELPTDPFDGQPLRYRQRSDGVIIYSVGPDLKDNRGTLYRKNDTRPDIDVGFQLWDVQKRRQPPWL